MVTIFNGAWCSGLVYIWGHLCLSHHSLRDAVDTSGYQECHWTEGLLSFPEEVRTDKCSARIGHWQQTEYTVLSNCSPISEFVEVSGVWVRGGLTSTGVIRSDSAAASLKRPQPGEDSWKLKQSGSHRVRQSPSLPPSSPSRFYTWEWASWIYTFFWASWDLGVYFLVLRSLPPGWECFNSEGTDTHQAQHTLMYVRFVHMILSH